MKQMKINNKLKEDDVEKNQHKRRFKEHRHNLKVYREKIPWIRLFIIKSSCKINNLNFTRCSGNATS